MAESRADTGEAIHVLPVDDLVEHNAGEDCVCGPTVEAVPSEDGSMGWLIKHHSLDGREDQEVERGRG